MKFKAFTTTWTHNSKSFILYIYFNGAPLCPFVAYILNSIKCEHERRKNHKIVTFAQQNKNNHLRNRGYFVIIASSPHPLLSTEHAENGLVEAPLN